MPSLTLKRFVITCLIVAVFAQCSDPDRLDTNSGIAPDPNVSDTKVIRLGKLNEHGQTTIGIPLNLLAKSVDTLNKARLDIAVNHESYIKDLAVTDYYQTNTERLAFIIPPRSSASALSKALVLAAIDTSNGFANNTTLTFTIEEDDGEEAVYEGRVESTKDTTASRVGDETACPEQVPISDTLEAGRVALMSKDLVEAEKIYCTALGDDQQNSQLAFGCFGVKALQLPRPSVLLNRIFSGFGQPKPPTANEFPLLDYLDIQLPLIEELRRKGKAPGDTEALYGGVVGTLVDAGTTTAELEAEIDGWLPLYAELEDLLTTVVADPCFRFVVPGEFYDEPDDRVVVRADAQLFLAGVKAAIVAYNLARAYDNSIEIDQILNGNQINVAGLVNQLNNNFLELRSINRVTAQRVRFAELLANFKLGLDWLIANGSSDYFPQPTAANGILPDIVFIDELSLSLTNGMTQLTSPRIKNNLRVNLDQFFAAPFDATGLNADPFIYGPELPGGPSTLQPVEAFFETLTQGVIDY